MSKIQTKINKLLSKEELNIIKKLSNPLKIQDFLDKTPFNFEQGGETYYSPRKVLDKGAMHCFEGALFATLCLSYHNFTNYLLDLKVKKGVYNDSDHTICIFEVNKFWGAISKTNHSVLRWRDPIYKDYKEIAKTYYHEYFLDSGTKTLGSFSEPFDVWKKFGFDWLVNEKDLDEIAEALDNSKHTNFVPLDNARYIRKVGKTEIMGAGIEEWKK